MSNYRVLFADPDPIQHKLVDMLFSVEGFGVDAVETGRAALEFLKKNTPDLAILAVELPDIDGPAICSRMKSISRLNGVPVILVAESTERFGISAGLRSIARDVGAELLIQKPLGDKNLRERARRLIEGEAMDADPAAADRAVNSTQILDDTLREIESGATVSTEDDPAIRISALQEENRALRMRINELEQALSKARGEA